MAGLRWLAVMAIALATGGCEARFGNDAGEVPANASADGKAEAGRLTVQAPGFNLSVQIPEGVRSRTQMGEDNGLIYPSSTFEGVHVQGGPAGPDGDSHGEVELRFSTSDAMDRVVAWYRDPARGEHFRVETMAEENGGFRLTGTASGDGDRFALHLVPTPGGGAEARLLLAEPR